MGLSRSTYYDKPSLPADDAIVATMTAICDEFEAYGYRRVGAELRHRGMAVNSKKVRPPDARARFAAQAPQRFVATTDSNHESPIFPDLARGRIRRRPEPSLGGGYHLHRDRRRLRLYGRNLDAWSRRVVGYAISRSIDVRVAVSRLVLADRRRGSSCGRSAQSGRRWVSAVIPR